MHVKVTSADENQLKYEKVSILSEMSEITQDELFSIFKSEHILRKN